MRTVSRNAVPALTTEQMRAVDRAMVEDLHIELIQMMENAGHGPARIVSEPGEKRMIASSARLRPAFSIIWTSSMCRSSTMARSTARICSVVSAGTAVRLTERIGSPPVFSPLGIQSGPCTARRLRGCRGGRYGDGRRTANSTWFWGRRHALSWAKFRL